MTERPTDIPEGVAAGEVHLWHCRLAHVNTPVLDDAERGRAEAIRDPLTRRHFVAARSALRHVLGGYLGLPAARVALRLLPGGKPALRDGDRLHFSLSHTGNRAVVAVCAGAVGVDLERPRRVRRLVRVAERLLHPATAGLLARTPEPRRTQLFLDAWTQREAHVKAIGGGMFRTPDSLPFVPDLQDAELHAVRDAHGCVWRVARLTADDSLRIAVVAHAGTVALHQFQWNTDTFEEER